MAPFAGEGVAALDQRAIDDQAAADPGAQDGGEDDARAGRGAVRRFGQGQAVGVVGEPDRPAHGAFQVGLEGPAIQVRGVGVAHPPVGGRGRSRPADAHGRPGDAGLPLHRGHQLADRGDAGLVFGRTGDTSADQHAALRVERRRLDLGAAEVHADPDHGVTIPDLFRWA
jgi:hypothetical protein